MKVDFPKPSITRKLNFIYDLRISSLPFLTQVCHKYYRYGMKNINNTLLFSKQI